VIGEVSLDRLRNPGQPAWQGLGGCATYLSLALGRLGVETLFATVAGDDLPPGSLTPLQEAGVDLHLRRVAGSTARLDITYDETGDVVRLRFETGVESQMDADCLPQAFWQADWIVVGTAPHGYQQQVILRADQRGRLVALSTQTEFEGEWNVLGSLLPHLDVLFTNSSEVVNLRGDPLPVGLKAMRRLNSHLTCLVTCGQRGALLLHGDSLWKVEAYPVPVVDTTGAGDAFAAAWLASWAQGSDIESALRPASVAASLALRGPAYTTLASAEEIEIRLCQCRHPLPLETWPAQSREAQAVLSAEDAWCHQAIDRKVSR
jgi:sugar/nucleoside kinase (ribokinase family)